ncbi:MAG: glycosyltransferase family 2 protein [Candidatus Doudnabacteria bacterium]|nr:glycosyltransferase family 2 protein [Candidatus Doudnabacteria bacterium]
MADLSVIIVNFNTKDKLRACLRSVFASRTKFNFEVWVADNASSDGSVVMVREEFGQVKLIENNENVGFAKANNQALRKAQGRYFLLLNSDVEVSADSFDKMLVYMDNNPMVGAAGCRVMKTDGTLDKACRRSFPNPVNSFFRLTGLSFLFPRSRAVASYNLTYLPEDQIAEVDSVMGAFLLIRRDVVARVGLLDEQFFMYGEDLDWCYRIKAAGYRVMYVPTTSVIHHKGSSSRKLPQKALYEFHRAMELFYNKHYRTKYNFLLNLIAYAGIWLRYAVLAAANSVRQEKYVSK